MHIKQHSPWIMAGTEQASLLSILLLVNAVLQHLPCHSNLGQPRTDMPSSQQSISTAFLGRFSLTWEGRAS